MGKNSQSPKLLERQFSAGGVVFKKKGEKVLWLVTKSASSKEFPKGFWRLPKGWIDNDSDNVPGPIARGERKGTEDELQTAALREVSEEAGVIAKIVSKIGSFQYFLNLKDKRILKFVTFYLMEYLKESKDGHDWETSEVSWLEFEGAYQILSFPREKELLEKAKEVLGRPRQESLI